VPGFNPALFIDAVFPRVEDPWPKSIGLGFPFALAGAGGVLAGAFYADAPSARRDRAVSLGGLWGFRLGAALYLLSLGVQIVFGP
jgi:hypothetical protein